VAAIHLTRTHRILVGVVVAGAVIIAGIGFAGSYAAVRTLALHKGFGWFANVFPIGVDAGIVVLLALDLLLTWLRIPFPLLRQTAWLLTAATIAFNGAAAWPDKLGVGMHAIIPVLFVVSVEAARHAIGRIADLTADKHMESVRITRWVLAPLPTFRLWRRMKLWELRSYEEVIRREQERLVYRARLRARYGVAWRRRAPVEAMMPLRLARYGVPLAETAEAGLEAAGIELPAARPRLAAAPSAAQVPAPVPAPPAPAPGPAWEAEPVAAPVPAPGQQPYQGEYGEYGDYEEYGVYEEQYDPAYEAQVEQFSEQEVNGRQAYAQEPRFTPVGNPWFHAAQQAYTREQPAGTEAPQQVPQIPQAQVPQAAQMPQQMVPSGAPGRTRPLGSVGMNGLSGVNGFTATAANGPANGSAQAAGHAADRPRPPFRLTPDVQPQEQPGQGYGEASGQGYGQGSGPERGRAPGEQPHEPAHEQAHEPSHEPSHELAYGPPPGRFQEEPQEPPQAEPDLYPVAGLALPDDIPAAEAYFYAYRRYVDTHGTFPNARQFARFLPTAYPGTPPEERELVTAIRELRYRFESEADAEHIP
jgi:hypothetical protein